MKFRTEIDIAKAAQEIDYQKHTTCIGSCFADRMGSKMQLRKFSISLNPLGILYNPFSISHIIKTCLNNEDIQPEYAEHLGEWHSFDLHGIFNNVNREIFEKHDVLPNYGIKEKSFKS